MEEQKRLEIWLNKALTMEEEAKNYYSEMSKKVKDNFLEDFFTRLMELEERFISHINHVYQNLGNNLCWKVDYKEISTEHFFEKLSDNLTSDNCKDGCDSELMEAINTSLDFVKKTLQFYKEETKNVGCSSERDFLTKIAAEKQFQQHFLLDFKEFISDPETWMMQNESAGLDGA